MKTKKNKNKNKNKILIALINFGNKINMIYILFITQSQVYILKKLTLAYK